MVYHIKRLILLLVMFLLVGCTDLGDILVAEYNLGGEVIQLKDLDVSYLGKERLGNSPHCLTRRSNFERDMWMGVCYDKTKNKIAVYRAFPNKFNIQKNGITRNLVESEDYKDFMKLRSGIEEYLDNRGSSYQKVEPRFIPFREIQANYQFTR
tara:strand:+ start:2291 stop:2749 length:459 start_codon:yes stop_codon:yes gene_type:complete